MPLHNIVMERRLITNMKPPFVIKVGEFGFITRSQFGPFYGNIVVHPDIGRAALFTHKRHADQRVSVFHARMEWDAGPQYPHLHGINPEVISLHSNQQ